MTPTSSYVPAIGDFVALRGKVIDLMPENVCVELFSKTDQYDAWVRPDQILGQVPTPEPTWQANDAVLDTNGVLREARLEAGSGTDADSLRWYLPGSAHWLPTSMLVRPLDLLVRDGKRWEG